MGNKSKENLFKEYFTNNCTLVRDVQKIKRQSSGTPTHLRFHLKSGIESIDTLTRELTKLKIKYRFTNIYTRTPNYKGNGVEIEWNGDCIGLLVANHNKGGVNRKQYTPDALKLNGLSFTKPRELRIALEETLVKDKRKELLFSLLDNIQYGNTVPLLTECTKEDINRISCDFGEVIVAFDRLLKGFSVKFPEGSNNPLVDVICNEEKISVKGHNASNNINLSKFKNYIDRSTDIGAFLYSLASHDRSLFLQMSFKVCHPLGDLYNWIGGSSVEDLKNFTKRVSYDEFYSYIRSNKRFKGLGVPLKDEKPRELWLNGDLNPFFFTLNTLVANLWNKEQKEQITKLVNNLDLDIVYVKVEIKNNNVLLKETNSTACKEWTTKYWSRAYAAFHNWMGVVVEK